MPRHSGSPGYRARFNRARPGVFPVPDPDVACQERSGKLQRPTPGLTARVELPRSGDNGTPATAAGKYDVNLSNTPSISTVNTLVTQPEPDWCVLVLWADDTEKDLKGIWGPFTDTYHVEQALAELQQWPLDGRWDVRRLNKFVARKAGNPPNTAGLWTWQNATVDC